MKPLPPPEPPSTPAPLARWAPARKKQIHKSSGTSPLALCLKNLRTCSNTLRDLSGVWPTQDRSSSLSWDTSYQVLFTAKSQNTYRALFGSCWNVRTLWEKPTLRARVKSIRAMLARDRLKGPFQTDAALPSDSVVLPPVAEKQGLVVASYTSGRVLKVARGRPEVSRETANWAIVKEAGIEAHVPMVIDHGRTSDGNEWMLTSFAPNTDPLDAPLSPWTDRAWHWRQCLRWKVLPTMQRYYEAAGIDLQNTDDLLARGRAEITADGMPEAVFKILKLAEEARLRSNHQQTAIVSLHNDLNPNHVHRHGTQWWIIDWGSSVRGPTSKDVVNKYICRPIRSVEQRAFWSWLKGSLGFERLPSGLRSEIELYLDWYASWRKLAINDQTLRCELLISVLNLARGAARRTGKTQEQMHNLRTRADLPEWIRDLGTNLEALGVLN